MSDVQNLLNSILGSEAKVISLEDFLKDPSSAFGEDCKSSSCPVHGPRNQQKAGETDPNLITQDEVNALTAQQALDLAIGSIASADNSIRMNKPNTAEMRQTQASLWLEVQDRLIAAGSLATAIADAHKAAESNWRSVLEDVNEDRNDLRQSVNRLQSQIVDLQVSGQSDREARSQYESTNRQLVAEIADLDAKLQAANDSRDQALQTAQEATEALSELREQRIDATD